MEGQLNQLKHGKSWLFPSDRECRPQKPSQTCLSFFTELSRSAHETEELLTERSELKLHLALGSETMEQQRQDYTGIALRLEDFQQQLGLVYSARKTAMMEKDVLSFRCV